MQIGRITLSKKEDPRGWLIENESNKLRDSMRHFHISFSKPNVVRGQHYHKRKTEWFLVIKGGAKISFKDIITGEKRDVLVSGEKPEIIEVPPMIAHSIINLGSSEMCLVAFVSEPLDKNDPDTFPYKSI